MIDYIDNKARWQLLSIIFALFIALTAASTYFATLFVYEWLGIIIGCVIILLAIIPHRIGKRNTVAYILSVSMNAVGTGFAISAYYIVKQKSISFPEIILVPICAAIAYTVVNFLISVFRHKKLFVALFGTVAGLTMALSVVFWIINGKFIYSFSFFASLLFVFFLSVTAISIDRAERVALRDLSFGAFGSFVIATMVVVAILSEGDIVDGFDIADVTKKNKKSQKLK